MNERRPFGLLMLALILLCGLSAARADLKEIQDRGYILHLGVPYARFVTGDGDGLDAAILKRFAKHIGVEYRYVKTTWDDVFADLTGKQIKVKGSTVETVGEAPIKGDLIGNGLTVIPWRKEIISFSRPYIPTAIWVLARADSGLTPIPEGSHATKDIAATKALLRGKKVVGIRNTCVDPTLYDIKDATPEYLEGGGLNDLAPALVRGDYEVIILDVPDSLVALTAYPGRIKVIGPITDSQEMAFGFPRDSPNLLESFNSFMDELEKSGELSNLILRYYPNMKDYFPSLFTRK